MRKKGVAECGESAGNSGEYIGTHVLVRPNRLGLSGPRAPLPFFCARISLFAVRRAPKSTGFHDVRRRIIL